ncbi:hypothetical protein [Chamaesiphon polymorphus]|uniref:Uncharacterized protein n=1 Tax=Chamaesiphon polymorphus CCALA 037 TaxID=2107692 RepID=A0A2T1GI86_9CYAN|nr:hypothetical protein [Chamaesiphon polymorphus]PSB57337.1 hypothetical protein C7B77_08705 [Chamaesiphon polymorphus CCALA 037]
MELLHDDWGIRQHCFKDNDLDPRLLEQGKAIVLEILKLQSSIDISSIEYNLSFYSGGIGIIDKVFIKLSCDSTKASEIISSLKLVDISNDNLDWELRDYLISRTIDEDSEEPDDSVEICTLILNNKISRLVNEEKADFQDIASSEHFIYFGKGTGPNHGEIIYYLNGSLNYISYAYG